MVPAFPARRWLAAALLICGLGGVHTAGQSQGVPPGSGGGLEHVLRRARRRNVWKTTNNGVTWEPVFELCPGSKRAPRASDSGCCVNSRAAGERRPRYCFRAFLEACVKSSRKKGAWAAMPKAI